MAARGSIAKEQITNQILASFNGAFKYDKEIRIPVEENGEIIQIKVTLTAAKTNVEVGGDVAVPGAQKEIVTVTTSSNFNETSNTLVEPTAEEKENVAKLIASLF